MSVVGFAVVVPACASSKNAATAAGLAETCSLDSDCASMLVCTFGNCHLECKTTSDCTARNLGLCVESDKPYKVCQNPNEEGCVRNSDCAGAQICAVDDRCRNACITSKDCIVGQTCVSGVCADPLALVGGALPAVDGGATAGASCVYASDCPATLVCIDGICTQECITLKDCRIPFICVDARCVPEDLADSSSDAPMMMSDGGGSPDAGRMMPGDASSEGGPSDGGSGDGGQGDGGQSDGGGAPTCAIASGLVGYWPFEEGTGTTTADLSPSNNVGVLTNAPQWSTSTPPTPYANTHSLSFDGSVSYVTMGNPPTLRLTGAISVACWFQTSASFGDYRTLVSKWYSGGTDAAFSLYWVTTGPNFSLGNTMNGENAASAMSLYQDGNWHFIAGTWDGAAISVYIDGVLRQSVASPGFGALKDVMDPFDVATDNRYSPGSGDRFFPGLIDDVRVYNRALSAAEVGKLYDGNCAVH